MAWTSSPRDTGYFYQVDVIIVGIAHPDQVRIADRMSSSFIGRQTNVIFITANRIALTAPPKAVFDIVSVLGV